MEIGWPKLQKRGGAREWISYMIFSWCEVRVGSKNGPQRDMCLKRLDYVLNIC